MFSRSERLNRQEFNDYFKKGSRFNQPLLQLIYIPEDKLKVAVVVGKKVSKQAVVRNRLRRQTYHSLREALKVVGVNQGVFIVILRPQIKDLPRPVFNQIKDNLTAAIAKTTITS